MKKEAKISLAYALVFVLGAGCATNQRSQETAAPHGRKAVAVLSPTQGNNVTGTITFTEERDGVRVIADVRGLTPGSHGFHVHDKGDCSAPDAASAGSHFNPENMPHGGPDAAQRHAGDLGNIMADASGHGRLDRIDHHLSFSGPNSILGRAVIVHAKADDLKSQPAGDAGARVACGVIQ